MSKKKMQVDKVDLDSSLEFDDFDMGFPSLDDDRKPASKPGKAFVKGVGRGITDRAIIEDLMKKNLPSEYGDAFNTITEVASGAKTFTSDLVKESKPIISNLANAADKFLPSNFKAAKEKLNKIKDWADKSENGSSGPSKEEQRKLGTGIELGRIFSQQQELEVVKDKINKKEKDFDRGLDMAKHKDILSVLTNLSNSSARTSGYTTTINSAWQRKSLETQFHQLFVLQDILEETKKSNATVISSLEAITKNSALPEYRKTNKDEAFLEEARRRFSTKIVDASHNFFRKGLIKMRGDVSAIAGDLASVTSMLSLAGDMHQMGQEFDPKTMGEQLSGAGGSMIGKYVLGKAGGKIAETIKKNPKAVEKIAKGKNFLKAFQQDGAGLLKSFLNKKEEEGSSDGLMSSLFNWMNNSFEKDKPNYAIEKYNGDNAGLASPFTNKVAHSITDVIPGYLSRILQEQTSLRTGNNTDRVVFDYRSGKFNTSKNIIKDFKKDISEENLSSSADTYFRNILAKIEQHEELNDAERSEIAKGILKKSSDGSSLEPSKMTNEDHWKDYVTNEKTAGKLASSMKKIYGTDNNKEFYGFNADNQQKSEALAFNDEIIRAKNVRRDLHAQAQRAADAGLSEYATAGGLLDSNGNYNLDLIDKNSTKIKSSFKGKGDKDVDVIESIKNSKTDYGGQDEGLIQGLVDLVQKSLKTETEDEAKKRILGDSDEDIKDHIGKTGNVLGPISRLPIKEWQYKPGFNDDGKTKNIGPMAQDMNKEFGEEVAPEGKKIDLVNSNGIAFKGIQELNDKVNKLKNDSSNKENESSVLLPNVLSCLRGIYYNTDKLVSQGLFNINLNTEAIKNMALAFGQQLSDVDLKGASDSIKSVYGKAKKAVKDSKASTILGRIGDALSGGIGGGFSLGKSLISSSYKGAKKSMGFVSKELESLFDKGKLKALETFDVYVSGEEEPRMTSLKIRQGHYLDFVKQSPVRTRQDVRDAVGGISEVRSNGDIEIILTGDELKDAVFVNTHKALIERVLIGTKNTLVGGVTGLFNQIIKPSFLNGSKILNAAKNFATKLLDQPIDIYLKSDPSKCVLLAKVMREGGYIDQADGTTIERPGQIKGAVFNKLKGEIAVTLEEFRDGLVDINGKKIGFSLVKGLVGAAIGAGSSIMNWTLGKITKAPGVLGKLASKGTELMKALASKLGIPSFTLGNFFGTQAVDILKDIRAVLMYQSGLADKPKIEGIKNTVKNEIKSKFKKAVTPGLQKGGVVLADATPVQEEKANVNEVDPNREVSESSDSPTPSLGGALLSGIGGAASLIGSFFKRRKGRRGGGGDQPEAEESEETKEKNTQQDEKISKLSKTIKFFKDKAKNKKEKSVVAGKKIGKDGVQVTSDGLRVGSWQERARNAVNVNKEKILDKLDVKKYAVKNIFTMIADMVGSVKKKLSSWVNGAGDAADLADDIADGADGGRRRKGGRRGGRGPRGGGKGGLLRRGASKLGGLGRLAGGIGLRGLGYAGAAYSGYSAYQDFKEGDYAGAALNGGLAAGTLALSIGGTAGLASMAGATLAGAGALAAGTFAVLTAPITLAAIGIAGAAYGGYKAYQYLSRKEFNPTEVMRMLEYGLRGADGDKMRKVYELESYLDTVSSTTTDAWQLDDKKFDMKKVFDIFDINEKDNEKITNFVTWFNKRFRTVFAKWKLLVKLNGGDDSIGWLEKAPKDKLLEIYKNFKLSQDVYSVSASPFADISLNTDTSVIENFKKQWIKELAVDAIKSKDKDLTAKAMVEAKKEVGNKPGDKTSGVDALENSKPFVKVDPDAADRFSPNGTIAANANKIVTPIADEVESKTYADTAKNPVDVEKKNTSGTVSSLPGAAGDLLTGSGGTKYLTMDSDVDIDNLHPSIKRLFLGMVEEYGTLTGKKVQVNRAFSSFEAQTALYKKNSKIAAKPGTSLHEFGLAIDAQSSDLDAMDKLGLLRKYGFTRPMGGEPWHIEAAGIHDNTTRQRAKKDHNFAESFIESGVGRGGGGIGARGAGGRIYRDDNYAKMAFNANSTTVNVASKDTPEQASAKVMTSAATTGASTSLATGGKQSSFNTEGIETKDGKVPSNVGNNASSEMFNSSTKAANDSTMQASKDLATGESKGGSYQSIPDTKGNGWENNKDMILAASKMVGVDPATAAAIAAKESSFKPNAQGVNSSSGNSTAQGLYQFMPGTWNEMISKHGAKYGISKGTSPLDARANAILGMEYIRASAKNGDGSAQEAYLGHFLGASGFNRLKGLKDDDIAANSFQKQAANNPNVFYQNGDKNKPYTKSQLIASIGNSLNKNLQSFNVPLSIGNIKEASNDTQYAVNKPSVSAIEKSTSTGNSDIVKTSYTPSPRALAESVPDTPTVNASMSSLINQAPVSTARATAPIVENSNNGVMRLEKVSNDQLKEQKVTNVILNEIKDILAKSFNNASAKNSENNTPVKKAEAVRTVENRQPDPVALPDSYVQRRRA